MSETDKDPRRIDGFLDANIKRETKIINFEDTNLINEETSYLIEFEQAIDYSKKYLIDTPFSYFRIPEKYRSSLRPDLMEIEPIHFYEKIIWYFIFEEIFGNQDPNNNNEWKSIRDTISIKLKDHALEEKLKKRRKKSLLTLEIKNRLREIELKKYIEDKETLKKYS